MLCTCISYFSFFRYYRLRSRCILHRIFRNYKVCITFMKYLNLIYQQCVILLCISSLTYMLCFFSKILNDYCCCSAYVHVFFVLLHTYYAHLKNTLYAFHRFCCIYFFNTSWNASKNAKMEEMRRKQTKMQVEMRIKTMVCEEALRVVDKRAHRFE